MERYRLPDKIGQAVLDVYKRQDYDYMEQYGNVDMKEAIKCGTCSADYGKDVCGAHSTQYGASGSPRLSGTS